ncbi:zinc finger protein CONSTANS-LIKE 2 [Sesamum indicum]|uniref:Zinc finger protein CONSTANS-LIKE 2 n=1 Tax=Sesamum indicum TaxID=4182 RepID=A0A6I9T1T6_SESIN|nr:zinc finger protein CONSTANS-LIKE 2 [Sesamum indicum]
MSSDLFPLDNSVFFQPFSPFTQNLQEIHDSINVLIQENNTSQFQSSSLSHLGKTDCFSAYSHSFLPHTFDQVHETALNFRQQQCYSYSSNDQNFSSRRFSRVSETQNSDNHVLSSAEDSFSMKGICTTGDLQKGRTCVQTNNVSSTSPLSTDESFMEETNFKACRYSAEERKERIDRYRAKRNQRNFNKTIKYACRKTLADSRPRIRGRFARNDEARKILKAPTLQRCEEEDDAWIDGFYNEDGEGIAGRGSFFDSFASEH